MPYVHIIFVENFKIFLNLKKRRKKLEKKFLIFHFYLTPSVLLAYINSIVKKITTGCHYSLGIGPILIVPQPTRGLGHGLCGRATSGAPHGLHAGLVIGFLSDGVCRAEHQGRFLLG